MAASWFVVVVVVVAAALLSMVSARPIEKKLAKTPPMVLSTPDIVMHGSLLIVDAVTQGWMSWEQFRCDCDCAVEPEHCIDAKLYESMTDALVSGGFLAAGLFLRVCSQSGL